MTAKSKKALEAIRRSLESETDPKRLSRQEYIEVIEELSADLEGSLDAVRAEQAAEEAGE